MYTRLTGSLRILLIDENSERVSMVKNVLVAGGHEVVGVLGNHADLESQVERLNPDVIIVDMESPTRDALEGMRKLSRERPKPVVMFVDRSDDEMTRTAVQAGVSAYVVDGLNPSRVKPILEAAVTRFEEFQSLKRELEEARNTLADRKLIERAKGIFMRRKGLSEEAAYQSLRKLAMDRNQRLVDVANRIIDADEVL